VNTIVVGIDGSETSIRALIFAADLAERVRNPQLIVVHARWLSQLWMPPTGQDEFSVLLDRVEEMSRDAADDVMAHRSIEWKFVTRAGEPSEVLHDLADETDAMFIVVGRRGWSTFRELVMGSVSNRLVHRQHDNVLLV
jgi:nucleotide-binding universal stress UspA family protein